MKSNPLLSSLSTRTSFEYTYFRLAALMVLWTRMRTATSQDQTQSSFPRLPSEMIWPDPSFLSLGYTEGLSALLNDFYQHSSSLSFISLSSSSSLPNAFSSFPSLTTLFSLFPSQIKQDLNQVFLKNCALSMHRTLVLKQAWSSTLPSPLLIKGSEYESTLYPSIGLRPSSDWDFILPSQSYADCVDLWTQKYSQPLYPSTFEDPQQLPYSLGFYIDHLLFEVHRDPAPHYCSYLKGEELYQRSQPHPLDPFFRIPSPQDRLWIWLVNFAKGGGLISLLHWVDFALILHTLFEIPPFTLLTLNQKKELHQASFKWKLNRIWLEVEVLYTHFIQGIDFFLETSLIPPRLNHSQRSPSLCPHPLSFPHPYHQNSLKRHLTQWILCPSDLRVTYFTSISKSISNSLYTSIKKLNRLI